MKKNRIALQIVSFGLIALSFIACDNDFASLNSDVLNSDVATNFDIYSTNEYNVTTYTKPLAPVQTNRSELTSLSGLTNLGVYDDAYGRTTASFVTQLTPSIFDPTFGDEARVDSVVVTIPYFSTITGIDDDGKTTYSLDSVISKSENYSNIKLNIFENNYFIRDFDPSAGFDVTQAYFSDRSSTLGPISTTILEGSELTFVDYDEMGSNMFVVDNEIDINDIGYDLKDVNNLDENGDKTLLSSESPGMRIMLEPSFWEDKILAKEGDAVLSNLNNFTEYFRGLYFKAEAINDDGSFLILNTASSNNANITIYYSTPNEDDPETRDSDTYVLNFGSNKINFFDNDFTLPIGDGDEINGDSRIYLKGGEGATAGIKLFDGFDAEAGMSVFDKFRNDFVNLDDNKFESSKRLVNEANLIFYVDRAQLDLLNEDPNNEPDRLYLYDAENKTPLLDYYLDATNTNFPSFSKTSHLGPLERVEDAADADYEKGIKYKLRITEHINNLLLSDSTNVELGLAVSLNVNIEDPSISITQNRVKTDDDLDLSVPISSVLTPRGTILYGSNVSDQDSSKRVYLEIYYTEPNY
ncbi:DUF4270 domain-containing protein [Winogradskyella costae]|uniref:DUF4270 domain-containing protein n=1 Tax=Winogradskyella costae TaxID=2697008 RepID=UPI0015CA8708|nr:DUF4270 domain-containing protein [Winogradskyella costae]